MQNTALIVEPRFLEKLPAIIENFQTTLGPTWKIVFYCGKGLATKWMPLVRKDVEVRELEVNNFIDDEYSDFFKDKSLWKNLYGEWILTFQADTWLISSGKYTIDYFINKNKSYIGGNQKYLWIEMEKILRLHPRYRNFNGGLSLRKREHMLEIIDAMPPMKTIKYTNKMEADPEDVYFTEGCYIMGYPIGDDEDCSHFALHTIWKDKFFGIHQPDRYVQEPLLKMYPEVRECYLPTRTDDPPLYLPHTGMQFL